MYAAENLGFLRRFYFVKKEKDIQSLKAQSVWLLTAKIIGFALSFSCHW
ncbi:MAG: hypothetical protein IPG58_03635 [Acidobacteria bacterium]|nr:hypothetical protein [Acidobacteriota bacterium]